MHPTRYAYVAPRRTTAEMAQVRASRTLPPPPVAKVEDPEEWEHPEPWE
jgi:hypothetical protein